MNDILLVGINASYTHSNLAIRYLREYAGFHGQPVNIHEFTINQHKEYIVAEIFKQRPDVLGFSCYIWNISLIKEIGEDIKKIMPDTAIVLGGPEVSFNTKELLAANPWADYIVAGEGEEAFLELAKAIINKTALEGCCSITYRVGDRLTVNPKKAFNFGNGTFPYREQDFSSLKGIIIYYETQRGCPFKCAYCLSSAEEGVRFLNRNRVFRELDIFLANKVRQVKLVDRTFNASKEHRRSIWNYLIDNDNGVTGFHFEIWAELLDEEDFSVLQKARKGLFQFEIGVQSTYRITLEAIGRKGDFKKLLQAVKRMKELKTIHLHLDLIAGLPYEDINAFKNSFNDVFMLEPDALQLGFLKVLKGCEIRDKAGEYGIIYSHYPPYQVLATKDLPYEDILRLKNTEHILKAYYNSGIAINSIKYMVRFFKSPFDFFAEMGQFWDESGYHGANQSKMKLYEILLEFFKGCVSGEREAVEIARETIVFDILLNDNIKTFPPSLRIEPKEKQSVFLSKFYKDRLAIGRIEPGLLVYSSKQLRKQCNLQFFNYNIQDGWRKEETTVFFSYLTGKGKPVAVIGENRAPEGEEKIGL